MRCFPLNANFNYQLCPYLKTDPCATCSQRIPGCFIHLFTALQIIGMYHQRLPYANIKNNFDKCDVIEQNESEVENFSFHFFWHFLLGYYLSFNLVKPSQRLGNWFSRNSILSDCKNKEKQKKLSALFGYIFKLIFASSNSSCLIASHIQTMASLL